MKSMGRYTVIRKIGSGGMAEVFLARSRGVQGTEKLLVLKKVHPALAQNKQFIDMFVDEAKVAMRLNHTNIVQVYNFEHIEDDYILAMEYVNGHDLLKLENLVRKQDRRCPFELAAYITAQVAKGLDYAHSRCDDSGEPLEIVHRDVSPQNILMSREGAVKITDFGIARARWLHEEEGGAIKGKFGYMAPEQAAGKGVDLRSDIYSLGVVLYEMLTGRPLMKFKAGDDALTIIKETRHPSPIEVDPSIPRQLDEVVKKAMAIDPGERFLTAREMAHALGLYLHLEPEIYDSEALEKWINEVAPLGEEEAASSEEIAPTALSVPSRTPSKGTDTAIEKLGEVEQRATILVSGEVDVEQHQSRAKVSIELQRLIGEMTFKTEGALQEKSSGFSIFLGLLRSNVEDAIQGIRLANDILDATHALSRDHQLKIRVRLAVSRGIVRCLPAKEGVFPKFDEDLELSKTSATLLNTATYGEIVADDQIYQLARREYNFERSDADHVTDPYGEQESALVRFHSYKLIGARSRKERSREAPWIGSFRGREKELDQLNVAMRAAMSGRVVTIKLVGEVGIGKTRLVSRFLETSLPSSARLLKMECLFAERQRPLAAAVAATRGSLGLQEGEFGNRFEQSLNSLFKDAPRYRDRQVGFFKSFLGSPDVFWNNYKGGRRELIRRIAASLGVVISIQTKLFPAVLVVENAHWLDGPSIDVLTELSSLRASLPFLVLFVGRPATLAGQQVPGLANIEVKSLPDELLNQLILERLGQAESMQVLAEQILAKAQGNPFFTNEIVDSLIEQRIITPVTTEGRPQFRQAKPGTIRLPATMEGIAASRIDDLPQNQRTVLRTASAVGASYTLEILGSLVGRDVESDVNALVSQGLLAPMAAEPGKPASFHISQPMLRDAAYGGLSSQDQRRIHSVMAKRLIEDAENGEPIPRVRIAWHLDRSGETEAAGRYYLDAGRAAMRIYSDREALKLYDRAIPRLRENSKDRFEALAMREWVLRDLGRYGEREQDLNEMVHIAEAIADEIQLSHAKTRQALLCYDQFDFLGAAKKLSQALKIAVDANAAMQQLEALRLLAYVAIEQGHSKRALSFCNRALAVVKEGGEDELYLKGRALGIKGFVLYNMGHIDDAVVPMADAIAVFRRTVAPRNESQVMSNFALIAEARGALSEGIEFLESAIRIDAELYYVADRARKLAALASIQTELGDFEKAHANLRESRALSDQSREKFSKVEADLGLARLMLTEGDPTLAREILENMGKDGIVANSRIGLVRHRQLAASALFVTGFPEPALKLAEEATELALQAGMNGEVIHCRVQQGYFLAEQGSFSKALTLTRSGTDLLATLGRVYRAEVVWWLQALTMQKVGNVNRAQKALQEAQKEIARKRALLSDPQQVAFYDKHPMIRTIQAGLDVENNGNSVK